MALVQFTAPQATQTDAVKAERERILGDNQLGMRNGNPASCTLLNLLREDFKTHDCEWFSPGFLALAVHRFGNWRMAIRPRLLRAPFSLLYRGLERLVQGFCGISLGYTVIVGRRVHLWHQGGMTLSAIRIGDDVHIRQNVTLGVRRRGDASGLRPSIGDRCDIGAGAVIVGEILIGQDSFVGANVVLAQSVPPGSRVTVPRPVIKLR